MTSVESARRQTAEMHVATPSAHTRLVRSAVVRSRPRSIAVAAATPDTGPPSAVRQGRRDVYEFAYPVVNFKQYQLRLADC